MAYFVRTFQKPDFSDLFNPNPAEIPADSYRKSQEPLGMRGFRNKRLIIYSFNTWLVINATKLDPI